MIFTIEEYQFATYASLLDQMFCLRKKVFCDTLKWDVPHVDGRERDSYDNEKPVYVVLTDPTKQTLFASLRLLPTTGPTLLYDVFQDTLPEAANLSAPDVWECTRFCVDEQADAQRTWLNHVPASGLLLLAVGELGMRAGMSTVVANFDPAMLRIYKKAGCDVTVLGKTHNFGNRPVCSGTIAISRQNFAKMQSKMYVHSPVLSNGKGQATYSLVA